MTMEPELEQPKNRWEKFSKEARGVLTSAQEEAQALNLNYVDTEHILLGLLREKNVLKLLSALQIYPTTKIHVIEFTKERGEKYGEDQLGLTSGAERIVELAVNEAIFKEKDKVITSIHLLIGAIREGKGIAAKVMESLWKNTPGGRSAERSLLETIRVEYYKSLVGQKSKPEPGPSA